MLLTSALAETTYGRWILLLDVFIAAFLVLDLGLPTLLARDGPTHPSALRPAVWRVWRIQATVAVPVALIVGAAVLSRHPDVPALVLIAALVSLLHLATYAPRAALRAAGEARLEAWSKVVERSVMTGGYALFMMQGEADVLPYALVLAAGAAAGWLCSAGLLHRTLPGPSGRPLASRSGVERLMGFLADGWGTLALTAAVLPYVSRIEKFLLAEVHGYDAVAVFHVAQMAWVAGLVVPAAIRAALIPAFGAVRDSSEGMATAMRNAEAWIARLCRLACLPGHGRSPSCWTAMFPASYTSGCSVQTRATFPRPAARLGFGDDRHAFACRRSSRPQPMALCGPRRCRARLCGARWSAAGAGLWPSWCGVGGPFSLHHAGAVGPCAPPITPPPSQGRLGRGCARLRSCAVVLAPCVVDFGWCRCDAERPCGDGGAPSTSSVARI
ncbi:MAG: hypothetical protein CM15mP128_2470 [Methanobacteriota archaeon]|nr:MAG: hypothetical protein CM15mP128_2470 [Euryarchaeota archaeon]